MSPETSIIIVNYNCAELADCIKSVKQITYKNYEIIVVDNKSSDDSLKSVEKKINDVKIIKLDKNYGFGAGCNRGAEKAIGKYLVFLNPDSTVDKNWLESMLDVMKSDKKVGTATSKIMFFDKKEKINSLGCFQSIFGICGSITSFDAIKISDKNNFNVFAPSGASFAINKDLFNRIGGFDETLFLYAEDVDLGWRVLNEGFENVLVKDSVVYHKTSISTKIKSPYFYFYNTRNNLLIIVKNATFPYIIPMLAFSKIEKLSRFFIFMMTGRWGHAYATLRGLTWFVLNLKTVIKMRASHKRRKERYTKFISNFRDSIPLISNKITKHLG